MIQLSSNSDIRILWERHCRNRANHQSAIIAQYAGDVSIPKIITRADSTFEWLYHNVPRIWYYHIDSDYPDHSFNSEYDFKYKSISLCIWLDRTIHIFIDEPPARSDLSNLSDNDFKLIMTGRRHINSDFDEWINLIGGSI